MGMLGRYLDSLPESAKDRLLEAQDWCVGDVIGGERARCLIGHAEDWQRLPRRTTWWQPDHWTRVSERPGSTRDEEMLFACSREFFAFRQMQPLDFEVYRERVRRWGLASESQIGSRFDRLCARRGMEAAVRMVKRRAGRAFAPAFATAAPAPRSTPTPLL